MPDKIRVGIIFGGKSAEHEVSIQSAKNIIEAIDKDKYELVLIGIDPLGGWYLNEASQVLLGAENPRLLKLNQAGQQVALVPTSAGNQLVNTANYQVLPALDVVFPVMHGTFGEDGAIQGLLEMAGIPYVGSGVLGSAVGMDKEIMKRLLRDAGIPTPHFEVFRRSQMTDFDPEALVEALGGFPLFVKPANMGSSVGIHKVKQMSELQPALDDAFQYDHKLIIEVGVSGREIECSVLGNETPRASLPGEIIVNAEFYDYQAKYIDAEGARFEIPANLTEAQVTQVQNLAVQTFLSLNASGLARVDFFLAEDGQFYVNEINTLPGFTRISMYPKLWEASGIGYRELIDQLIQLALNRAEQAKGLKTKFFEE